MEHPNEPDRPGPEGPDPADEHRPDAVLGVAPDEDGAGTDTQGHWEDL
jgi:hypothetical protein